MSSPVPVPAAPAPFGHPAFLKLLRSAAVIATASIGLTTSAQPLSRQQQQQEMQRSQLDDPSFRELIPLIPERRVRRDERVPIFFPPNPPPLDRPVAHLVNAPGRLAAPLELTPTSTNSFIRRSARGFTPPRFIIRNTSTSRPTAPRRWSSKMNCAR